MRKESVDRIRQSVRLLLPQVDRATALFYDRLFTVAPATRALFKQPMDVQRQHFAASIAVILKNLAMMDVLTGPLRDLGAGHAAVGVKPEHYPPFRDALLHAMAEAIGPAWTAELAADWGEMMDEVSRIMLAGGTHACTREMKLPGRDR